MRLTTLQKCALGLAGITALAIGTFILFAPLPFYGGYGIALTPDASLLSELRAPGAGLAALGAIMIAGLLRPDWVPMARVAAFTVYLAFPAGRLIGIAFDGLPSGSILGALGIEIAIAALCIVAFRPRHEHQARPV